MFPHVPIATIRTELAAAGSVQGAVERLLLVASRYPPPPLPTTVGDERSTEVIDRSAKVTTRV